MNSGKMLICVSISKNGNNWIASRLKAVLPGYLRRKSIREFLKRSFAGDDQGIIVCSQQIKVFEYQDLYGPSIA